MSDAPEKPVKSSVPQPSPARRHAASQVVSMPVVLISAAVLLAVAAMIVMARQDSKVSAKESSVPTAEVAEQPVSAGRAGLPSSKIAEATSTRRAAPSVEEAPDSVIYPRAAAKSGPEHVDAGGATEEGPTSEAVGHGVPAENSEPGRAGGYARRRW